MALSGFTIYRASGLLNTINRELQRCDQTVFELVNLANLKGNFGYSF